MQPSTSSNTPTSQAELWQPFGTQSVVVCGNENALLRVVASEAAQNQTLGSETCPRSWLPLVLCGETGTGKSHVAQGLASWWSEQQSDNVAVLTSADLARTLMRTELADDITRFTSRQRNAALLVVEDIHQLAKRNAADLWLSHVLDHRCRHELPSVITCRGTLSTIKVSSRLRSRLAGGLCVPLVLPAADTRRELIAGFIGKHAQSIGDAELDRLVTQTAGKTIQGVQSHLASWQGTLPSERAVPVTTSSRESWVSSLLQTTAKRFGVRLADLKGPSRRKNTVLARAIAMFLLRELTDMSLSEIGKLFRNRDHTTVRHACHKIRTQLSADEGHIRDTIASICQALQIDLPPSCLTDQRDECA